MYRTRKLPPARMARSRKQEITHMNRLPALGSGRGICIWEKKIRYGILLQLILRVPTSRNLSLPSNSIILIWMGLKERILSS